MIASLKAVLGIAERKGCAIPAFNVYNMETVMGVAAAAREARSAVIFQVYSRLFANPEAEYLAPVIHRAIEELDVQAAFHLDHGAGIAEVVKALRLGASSVMLDASELPFEDNAAATGKVVELCRPACVSVEGELGHIGSAKDAVMGEFTKVGEAVRYCEQTGVDALAILVGTAHGRYRKAPSLDIRRIRDIREATGIPLVLHGGSGVPDDQIRESIQAGIRKINFGTDLCYAFLDALFGVSREIVGIDTFMKEPVESVKRFALEKIRLLGAEGSDG